MVKHQLLKRLIAPHVTLSELDPFPVLGIPIVSAPIAKQLDFLFNWAHKRQSRTVCLVDFHLLVEAYIQAEFQLALCSSDLIALNDSLVSKILKILRIKDIPSVSEVRLLEAICHRAAQEQISIYLLGSQNMVLDALQARLTTKFPGLLIAGFSSLPFGPASLEEDEQLTQQVNRSGAGIVLVSLGCKKQEVWMSQHRHKVEGVMVGLGAVFPLYIGISNQLPQLQNRLNQYMSAIQLLISYGSIQMKQFFLSRVKFFKTD